MYHNDSAAKIILCRDCGSHFVQEESEQVFLKQKVPSHEKMSGLSPVAPARRPG